MPGSQRHALTSRARMTTLRATSVPDRSSRGSGSVYPLALASCFDCWFWRRGRKEARGVRAGHARPREGGGRGRGEVQKRRSAERSGGQELLISKEN